MLDCEENGASSARDTGFAVNTLDVVSGRMIANDQTFGRFPQVEAGADEAKNLDLSLGQSFWPGHSGLGYLRPTSNHVGQGRKAVWI